MKTENPVFLLCTWTFNVFALLILIEDGQRRGEHPHHQLQSYELELVSELQAGLCACKINSESSSGEEQYHCA